MELANCLVALGGNRGNTVPKYRVTPAEIAVLATIHGTDAIIDVEPLDDEVARSNRDEIDRLIRLYPAKDEDGALIVRRVYPGVSPVLHQTIEDLGLPDVAFKTLERVTAKKVAKAAAPKSGKRAKSASGEPPAKPAPIGEIAGNEGNDATHLFDEDADEGVLN